MVASGERVSTLLHGRPGRDEAIGAAVARLADSPYPPEDFHRGDYHRLRIGPLPDGARGRE